MSVNKRIIPITVIVALVFLFAGIVSSMYAVSPQNKTEEKEMPKLNAPELESYPANSVTYGTIPAPSVTTNIWYGDNDEAHSLLVKAKSIVEEKNYNKIAEIVSSSITSHGAFSRYLSYIDTISIELNGKLYGAYVEDGKAPIGGGFGYTDIKTSGDYIVSTYKELKDALSLAKSGQTVYIEGDAVIDLTMLVKSGSHINIPEGVTLASNRGYTDSDGRTSTGAMLFTGSFTGMAIYAAKDSRVTGITISGPDPNDHTAHHTRAYGELKLGSGYYQKITSTTTDGIYITGDNVEVDNCEIAGFGHAGIFMSQNVRDLYIHHNYIHHCQSAGLGYGICHHAGTTTLIEYNLFNFNRHSIAATGAPGQNGTGYVARYNIEMGDATEHCFDMHGGSDRGDGTSIAGTYCEMYNNTFLQDQNPYWVRGVPQKYQKFYQNVCINAFNEYNTDRLRGYKIEIYDNIFGIENKTLVK